MTKQIKKMSKKYIKVNPLVAGHLGLESMRYRLPDGNYALYYNDFQRLGRYGDYERLLEETGSILLSGVEVASEQKGGIPHPLPDATLPQFFMERPLHSGSEEEDPENSVPEECDPEDPDTDYDGIPSEEEPLTETPESKVENPETIEDNDVTEQGSGDPVD